MYIKEINLKNFRCYENADLKFSSGTNIIYGLNAAGKTNILEAVYLFCTGRSHRRALIEEMIKEGCDLSEIIIKFKSYNRDFSGSLKFSKDKKKLLKINSAEIKKLSEISNYINIVMFSPEDLSIIKGFPSERRRFADMAISQIKPVYLKLLNDYIKTVAQRNSLLKNINSTGKGEEMLDVWDEAMAELASSIVIYRYNFICDLKKYFYEIYNKISSENIKMRYICSFYNDFEKDLSKETIKGKLLEKLALSRKKDIENGATQNGIHKDDFLFFIDKREVRRYASQGQQRSLVLSLKLALAELIKDIKGDYPIILLDDIASELDEKRRAYLKGKIKDKQVIITCTDKESNLIENDNVKYFYIKNSDVCEE